MQNTDVLESNFETFDPKEYLKEYYQAIDFENEQLLKFFAECYIDIDQYETLLEFGSGPTLYSLITAAANVAAIHVSDRLENNLREIQSWQRGDADSFNWDAYIRRALELEGRNNVTPAELHTRTELLRHKLAAFCLCDAFSRPPLQGDTLNAYDIVQVNFVPESITSSFSEWEMALWNILSLLKPQGTFILTALKNAIHYQVQEKNFPAVSIDEGVVMQTLKKFGFKETDIMLRTIPANAPYRGYSGIMLVKAQFRHN